VPDHPLLEARLERIRSRGGDPFSEYQLPEAVLKLKQGFGRLIRRATDSGRVVILDPRIRTRPYGRVFLDSLPECRVETEETWDDG
jgi:ATP-dependent DNA helicase DinG